ncbi:hypothetical protein [Terrabacter sp. 2RAF25]|uniref:hypothetical protein n=1 Tax=Terrabacter sp. 2RAF25 TaxID=3232998 RepID=UPI003F9B917B
MTETIEKQLREGLARLRDAAPAQPFDPADDLARGRSARRDARTRPLAGAAASVVAVAIAGGIWVQGTGTPTSHPAGVGTSSVAVRSSTPPPRTSSAAAPPLTGDQLGARMVAVVRAHVSGAGRYLGGWGDESSGSGTRTSFDDSGVSRFGITVSWGRKGSSSLGGVEIGSTTAGFARGGGETDSPRCGAAFPDAPSVCRLVRQEPDGSRLYYGSTGTTRAASHTRPDGRTAYVSVTAREPGNSLRATTAPLPSRSELLAVVTDPRLLWVGPLITSPSADPNGRVPWPNAPTGSAP